MPRRDFVIVLAGSAQLGGAERNMVELVAEETDEGTNWTIVARDTGTGPLTDLCRQYGLSLVLVRDEKHAIPTLRSLNPDMVWAFGLRWSLVLRTLNRLGRFRSGDGERTLMFSAQRGLDVWRTPVHNFVDRITQSFVDAYVANSHAAAKMLHDEVGIDPRRIHVVPSGLSRSWLAPPERRPREEIPRIVIIGNARPEKAHEDAVRVLNAARDHCWTATVYTNQSTEIAAQLEAASLADRVQVVVGRTVTPFDYDQADVLLHCSSAESLPRVVLEASARGLRIVATDVGDVSRYVEPTSLFAPGDIDAAKALLLEALRGGNRPPCRLGSLRTHSHVRDELESLVSSLRATREFI